ncbi:MAG: hypothetical protein ACK5QE_08095 [Sphingobacteriia bacterium]
MRLLAGGYLRGSSDEATPRKGDSPPASRIPRRPRHRPGGLYAKPYTPRTRHSLRDGGELWAKKRRPWPSKAAMGYTGRRLRIQHRTVDGSACLRRAVRHQGLDGTACRQLRIQHRMVDGTTCSRLRIRHQSLDGTTCRRLRIQHRSLDGTACSRLRIRHQSLDGTACRQLRIRHRSLDGTTCGHLKIKHTPLHKYRVPCDPSMKRTTNLERAAYQMQMLMRNHKKNCKLSNVVSSLSAGQMVKTEDYGTVMIADYVIDKRIKRMVRWADADSSKKRIVKLKRAAVRNLIVIVPVDPAMRRNRQGEVTFKRVLLSEAETKDLMIEHFIQKGMTEQLIRMYPEERPNLPSHIARCQYRRYGGVTAPYGIRTAPHLQPQNKGGRPVGAPASPGQQAPPAPLLP